MPAAVRPRQTDAMATGPGTYRVNDGRPVEMDHAKEAWAAAARPVLERVARDYHAVITYAELAEAVQETSGITTRQLMHYWIGGVLGRVAKDCHARGEPLLSALCVRGGGTIGDGYSWAIAETYGGEPPADLELHAAEERLKCYRHFGATLPPDGGRPGFTPQVTRQRARVPKTKRREPIYCSTCSLALPATGQCDSCD